MRLDLLAGCLVGTFAGWGIWPRIVSRIKGKRGIKSAPGKDKRKTGSNEQGSLQKYRQNGFAMNDECGEK